MQVVFIPKIKKKRYEHTNRHGPHHGNSDNKRKHMLW